ncbi:MAG: carbohydrate kinase family protein [Candidatus Thorarchaeota archaeon]
MNKVDIIGLGEVVIDWVTQLPHFPQPDEKIDAISENRFPGGVTANYLVAVARLGVSCGFMGAVGDDYYGNILLKDFIHENVDVSFTIKKGAKSTPINFIFIANGEKSIIQSPHMKLTKLDLEDLNEDYISNSKVLHTTLIHPLVSEKAIKIAKDNNVKVSIDLEAQIALRGWKSLKKMLLMADVLIPNKEGAKVITKTNSPEEAAKALVMKGIPIVIITLGSKGALITTLDFQERIPAFSVDRIIDTTGAGDAFNGAFTVAYWIYRWDIIKSCRFASGAAALKIQKLGARTGLPKENNLLEFLKQIDPNHF